MGAKIGGNECDDDLPGVFWDASIMAGSDRTEEDELREAARHRGLRLVKSRKRKPGTGDYGKFGLVDSGGKQVFGFTPNGLTGSPADIRTYLRKGQASTWAASARELEDMADAAPMPAENQSKSRKPTAVEPHERAPARKRSSPRARTGPIPAPAPTEHRQAPPAPTPPPPTPPPPKLIIRKATRNDATALAMLMSPAGAREPLVKFQERLSRVARRAPILVAERGDVIGYVQWQVLRPLNAGPIGRILLVVVARDEWRHGIARQLVERASQDMARAGCDRIEAISDIAVINVHGFFRALDFEQVSYRFVRAIDQG